MYTYNRRVTYSEVSMDGHVDIAKIADYFQDNSAFQSDEVGVGMGYLAERNLTWVLVAWQIVVKRYPVYGEHITVNTWPYNFDAYFGYRNFTLEDAAGERIAMANSQWMLINMETGHPSRVETEIVSHYVHEDRIEMDYAPRKIPFREEKQIRESIRIPRAFIDTNRHVNNSQYIRTALEYVPEDFIIKQVRVEYKKAAVLGDIICPQVYLGDNIIKVLLESETKTPYAIIEFAR